MHSIGDLLGYYNGCLFRVLSKEFDETNKAWVYECEVLYNYGFEKVLKKGFTRYITEIVGHKDFAGLIELPEWLNRYKKHTEEIVKKLMNDFEKTESELLSEMSENQVKLYKLYF